MKCPHCGQEHPDDFLLCPYTGKSLKQQTKVCGNPDCQYPNVPIEAKYCPRCGWKFPMQNENNNEFYVSSQEDSTKLSLNDFFPVDGVTLGKTTFSDAKSLGLEPEWHGSKAVAYGKNCMFKMTKRTRKAFNVYMLILESNLNKLNICDNLGFSDDLSIDDCKELLISYGFSVEIINPGHNGHITLKAISHDKTLLFLFTYSSDLHGMNLFDVHVSCDIDYWYDNE